MKITHSDCSSALKFQWTYITCTGSSSSGQGGGANGRRERNDEIVPRSRFLHATCLLGHYVYILGGKDRYSPLKDMWRFDAMSQEWQKIKDTETGIPHLQGHTMLAYKSQLLIFGGTFYDTNEDTPLWIYNTDLLHVRKYCCEHGSLSPVGRREHSAVIYKNSMYIYGGFLDNSGSTDEFWTFRIEEEEWRLIRQHKPGKRHGHVAVVASNNMWLHGGMKGLSALSDLWTFNFALSTWRKIKGLGTSPCLSNHTVHVVGDLLVLFGGSKNGILSQDIWTFKFETSTWRQILNHYGEVCPPISQHTSVMLHASALKNSNSHHTKSVPHLKGKTPYPEQVAARPWTSPTVSSLQSEPEARKLPRPVAADILNLEASRCSLDKNNNKSEESIYCDSQGRWLESETSFCAVNSDRALPRLSSDDKKPESSNAPAFDRKHVNAPAKGMLTNHCNPVLRQQGFMRCKIWPASAEHCADNLPLLQRFLSVSGNSDIDLGENNLTLTLSDEEIFNSGASDKLKNVDFTHELFKTIENSENARPLLSGMNSVSRAALYKCSEQTENIFEMKVLSRNSTNVHHGNNKEDRKLQPQSVFRNETDNGTDSISLVSWASRETDDVKFVNPLYQDVCGLDAKMNNETSNAGLRKNWFSDIRGSPLLYSMCSPHSLPSNQKSILSQSSCDNDLIIEDLEACDMGQLFHSLHISCPSASSIRWSSLKNLDVWATDQIRYENLSSVSAPEKYRRSKSCGNLASCQAFESLGSSQDLQQSLIGKEQGINSASYFHSSAKLPGIVAEEMVNSGKYIKHTRQAAGKNLHLHKSKFNKMTTSNSYPLNITKHSIGTQTSGSHISLQNSKSSTMLSFGNEAKYDHFVTQTSPGLLTNKDQAVSAATPPVSGKSFLGGDQLCILIIGGQTEHHSLCTEPLRMWRCDLY